MDCSAAASTWGGDFAVEKEDAQCSDATAQFLMTLLVSSPWLPREGGSNADRRCNEKANKSAQQPLGNRRLCVDHMIYLRKPSQFGNGDFKLAGVPTGMAILICHDRNAVPANTIGVRIARQGQRFIQRRSLLLWNTHGTLRSSHITNPMGKPGNCGRINSQRCDKSKAEPSRCAVRGAAIAFVEDLAKRCCGLANLARGGAIIVRNPVLRLSGALGARSKR